MRHPILAAVVSLSVIGSASAQFVGPGISWSGSSGAGVRSFVPDCSNLAVVATPGETVTLTVWGDVQAPYALFAAMSGTQCLPIPGLGNALVLDLPVFTVAFGVLSQTTPCLACPPGLQPMTFPLPPGLPRGTSISFQAVSFGNRGVSFTSAITGTV